MQREKNSETFMTKLARFIVDKRKAFYLIFIAAFLFSAASVNKVQVNNDITSYLPSETETRRGLTIMDQEFITLGSANIMVSNITYETAEALSEEIAAVPGVSGVEFDDTKEHYHDAAALFTVSFEGEEQAPETVEALERVELLLDGYDYYPSTTVGRDASASLQKEMTVILAIAVVVIVVVLLFTSKSYLEVPVYLIVFATAAVLNMGTNYWFGTISFITNAIAIVLQLALAIDYAIIFCHRYMEERDNGLDAREADISALSKAIVEISSSSLTTISGLVTLMLMQLRIGFDMGIVLAKGIVISTALFFRNRTNTLFPCWISLNFWWSKSTRALSPWTKSKPKKWTICGSSWTWALNSCGVKTGPALSLWRIRPPWEPKPMTCWTRFAPSVRRITATT